MRQGSRFTRLLLGAMLLWAAPAQAIADVAEPPHKLAFSPARDWTILGAGLALRFGLALGYGNRNIGCKWCDYDGDRDTLNGFDAAGRSLRWQHTSRAAAISDATLISTQVLAGSALVWMGQHAGMTWNESMQDAVMMGQAVAVSGLMTQVAKIALRRQRPYAHARGPGAPDEDAEDSLSFFSGHTASAFAFATSAATVATLRGYDAAPWMWTGVALAGTTGYLRMAADKHYATDVLVGAAVGTAVGVGMTYLLHGRQDGVGSVRGSLTFTVESGLADDGTILSLAGAF